MYSKYRPADGYGIPENYRGIAFPSAAEEKHAETLPMPGTPPSVSPTVIGLSTEPEAKTEAESSKSEKPLSLSVPSFGSEEDLLLIGVALLLLTEGGNEVPLFVLLLLLFTK